MESMPASTNRALVTPPEIPRRARFQAHRTANIVESVIREMTRLSAQHNAVNLAQGFPDFPAPSIIKQAAADAIAAKYRRHYNLELDPERELTVCCGATEGMIASLLAVSNPGDEVVIFEPHYENYGPDTLLCGAERKFVPLHPSPSGPDSSSVDWTFDPDELRRVFSSRTKAIILNSPGNPTGHVFDRSQLEFIASLCQEFDALAITDEIYEHIVYDGFQHVPMMTIPGMRDRTIMVNSMSKTYAVTGWRVGWVAASPDLTESIRKVHDFLTVGAAAPLQEAGVVALGLPDEYYAGLASEYQARRDMMIGMLDRAGFRSYRPRGAYYAMADISAFQSKSGFKNDVDFARHLIQHVGVAAVPGSSFFFHPEEGASLIRFCFCKKFETLELANERLLRI